MKALDFLVAFIGGAAVGAACGLLFAPEKGSDLREKIAEALRKRGIKLNRKEMSDLVDEIAEEIKTLDFGTMRLKIYVFSPGRYAFTDNFYEVEDKVEMVALPAAIYDAYQKVLPKRKEKLFEEEKTETIFPKDLFAGQEEGDEQ